MQIIRKSSSILVVFILSSAVILRLGVALYLGDSTPAGKDETSYSTLGWRLAEGHGYSFGERHYPGFVLPDTATSHWSFLYTAFVAGVYAVAGPQPLAVRLASAVLGGLLLPWMLHRLGRRIWPERESLALLAAGMGAVYAYFVLFSAQLMTETFFIAAVLWSLERSLALLGLLEEERAARRRLMVTALGLGASLGTATLLRQSILPWAAVSFALLLGYGWRKGQLRWALEGLLMAGMVLLAFVLPFTTRNYVAYGEFMLLNSNAGYAMYSAQHPMHGTSFQAFAAAPLPNDLDPLPQNEPQWDRALMARGFQFIVDEPERYALLSLSRVADFFMFWPAAETPLINNIGRVLSFGLFLPFMIYGLWLSRCDWRRYWFLYLYMGFYTMLHLLTWAMIRYRLPVDAVLLLFAALAVLQLGERLGVGAKWRMASRRVN